MRNRSRENDVPRALVALQGDAGRLVFSGEFTPLNIFAISPGSLFEGRHEAAEREAQRKTEIEGWKERGGSV